MTGREFWKSAGLRLFEPDGAGRLPVSGDFLRAYYTRPEIHPVEGSCKYEHALFEKLMIDPFVAVEDDDLAPIEDEDARENYAVVLGFRDHLVEHRTLEAAYLAFARGAKVNVPAIFLDQMVHVILHQILRGVDDPMRLRAAELFFREQNVNVDEGRIMLADREIVEMYARTGGAGGLGQLLVESGTAMKSVALDVLDDDNAGLYWERSDRFDTVIDFRFTEPALDAFARVVEAWVRHFFDIETRVQPMQRIDDEAWRWHIGLDVDATRILNALYRGEEVDEGALSRIIALLQMNVLDPANLREDIRGRPVYLGLAMSANKTVRMKPQNLLANLPLAGEA